MFRRLLVPVDGSRSSASIIPDAAEIAKRLGCQVDLLLVQPNHGPRLPHPEHHLPEARANGEAGTLVVGALSPEEAKEASERYLSLHAEEFEALGVNAGGHLRYGEPVDEILSAALELRSDMIAMATRHRGRFARPTSSSVAEEVLWRSRLPVLLIAEGQGPPTFDASVQRTLKATRLVHPRLGS